MDCVISWLLFSSLSSFVSATYSSLDLEPSISVAFDAASLAASIDVTSSSHSVAASSQNVPKQAASTEIVPKQAASSRIAPELASIRASSRIEVSNSASVSRGSSVTTNPVTNATTTPKPTTRLTTTPTTLSPSALKKIWCQQNYGSWAMPSVTGCTTTFKTQCSTDIINATNAYLVCKNLLGKNPSSQYQHKMLLPGAIDDLGMQLARNFYSWRESTANLEEYRLKRAIYSKMIMESGVALKLSDRTWPQYNVKKFFDKPKWNSRNDTIKLPYATIPSGVFKYVFSLYDNIFDADVTKEEMRLKTTWRSGHLISAGEYVDYTVEKDLIYNSKLKINSAVIGLSLEPKPKAPVASDVIIIFWHKKPGMFRPWCVYWQFVKSNDESMKYNDGYWSNYGMRVVATNATTTFCAASHLSHFALLMEPIYEEPPAPTDSFTIATIIMTIVSILILIIYLIAMVMLGCFRTQYSRMYMYIASGCLLSQIVFLLALMKKDDWSMCTTLSIILQLCHTTVMSWLMLESVHQLSRIRYFFNEQNSHIEAFYNCIGWGFPFAVIISLIGYPFRQFSKLKYCWVYVKGMEIWFFGGPLLVLLLISVILRLIAYYEIRKHPERLTRDINYQRAWRSLIASVFFLPLIAGLWAVGTIGVTKSDGDAGPYLVTLPVFNLVVGFMVFIFYFFKNDEVHDALIEQRKIREKKRLQRYEHLRGMKMKVKYRPQMN